MKKIITILVIGNLLSLQPASAQIPIADIIKQGIKKVIQAIDLQIQRIQTNTIWLQNAQKTLENSMSKLKLAEIGDWVQKQKDLYGEYFDELWRVKNAITFYQRVKDIIDKQLLLVAEYNRYYTLFKKDSHFTTEEISYIHRVYSGIIDESVKNIDQVFLVINSFATQMSDAKRLEIINQAGSRIDDSYTYLQQFNKNNVQLSLQRARDEKDLENIKQLYEMQ